MERFYYDAWHEDPGKYMLQLIAESSHLNERFNGELMENGKPTEDTFNRLAEIEDLLRRAKDE